METTKENNKKQKGIDWSKKDMYEGIGRPDLKPRFSLGKWMKKIWWRRNRIICLFKGHRPDYDYKIQCMRCGKCPI